MKRDALLKEARQRAREFHQDIDSLTRRLNLSEKELEMFEEEFFSILDKELMEIGEERIPQSLRFPPRGRSL